MKLEVLNCVAGPGCHVGGDTSEADVGKGEDSSDERI